MVEQALLALAGWLDAQGLSAWARGGRWIYPAANVLHVIGLAMFLGAIGAVDLRLAGLWRRLPIAVLNQAFMPVAFAGLALLAGSGIVLFAADGRALAGSWVFQIKLGVIALALANAIWFRARWQSRIGAGQRVMPGRARLVALLSLLLWLGVAALGRMIAYL